MNIDDILNDDKWNEPNEFAMNLSTNVLPDKNIEDALHKILMNSVDEDLSTTVHFNEEYGCWVIQNDYVRNGSGISKESFGFVANIQKSSSSTHGHHGYGLKDAIAILLRNDIEYIAFSEKTGKYVPCCTGKRDHESNETNIHVKHYELKSDKSSHSSLEGKSPTNELIREQTIQLIIAKPGVSLDAKMADAKIKCLPLSPSISSLTLLSIKKKKRIIGEVYIPKEAPLDSNLLFNRYYGFKTEHKFCCHYNLQLDKSKSDRDNRMLPPGWSQSLGSLICKAIQENEAFKDFMLKLSKNNDFKNFYESTLDGVRNILNNIKTKIEEKNFETQLEVKALQATIETKNREIENIQELLKYKEGRTREMYSEVADSDDDMSDDDTVISESDKKFLELQSKIQSLEKEVVDLETTKSEKINSISNMPLVLKLPETTIPVEYSALVSVLDIKNTTDLKVELYPLFEEWKILYQMNKFNGPFKIIRVIRDVFSRTTNQNYEIRLWNGNVNYVKPIAESRWQWSSILKLECVENMIIVHINLVSLSNDDTCVKNVFHHLMIELSRCPFSFTNKYSLSERIVDVANSLFFSQKLTIIPYKRVFCPMFVIDEWGTKTGGIAAFNMQIVRLLASHNINVYVFLFNPKQIITEDEMLNYEREEHILFPSIYFVSGYRYLERIVPVISTPYQITHVIGHVHITNALAADIVKHPDFVHCKLWMIVHVSPKLVDKLKENFETYDKKVMKIKGKAANINKLNKSADFVWSVGPLLFHHYKDDIEELKHAQIVLPLNPFFEAIKTPKLLNPRKVTVLFSGRTDEVRISKGVDIALAACKMVAESFKTSELKIKLEIRGMEDSGRTKLIIEEYSAPNLECELLEFGTQSDFRDDLTRADFFLMPSRTEPFGLVALEAIASGVPTLISSNSGAAEFLRNICPLEMDHFVVDTISSDNANDTGRNIGNWTDKLKGLIEIHIKDQAKAPFNDIVKTIKSKFQEHAKEDVLKKFTGQAKKEIE